MSTKRQRRLNEHGIRDGLANLRDTETRIERQRNEIQRKIGLLEVEEVTLSKSLAAVQFAIEQILAMVPEAEEQ